MKYGVSFLDLKILKKNKKFRYPRISNKKFKQHMMKQLKKYKSCNGYQIGYLNYIYSPN